MIAAQTAGQKSDEMAEFFEIYGELNATKVLKWLFN